MNKQGVALVAALLLAVAVWLISRGPSRSTALLDAGVDAAVSAPVVSDPLDTLGLIGRRVVLAKAKPESLVRKKAE